MYIRPSTVKYSKGVRRRRPDLAPVIVKSRTCESAKGPPTLPPFDSNSSTTAALKRRRISGFARASAWVGMRGTLESGTELWCAVAGVAAAEDAEPPGIAWSLVITPSSARPLGGSRPGGARGVPNRGTTRPMVTRAPRRDDGACAMSNWARSCRPVGRRCRRQRSGCRPAVRAGVFPGYAGKRSPHWSACPPTTTYGWSRAAPAAIGDGARGHREGAVTRRAPA